MSFKSLLLAFALVLSTGCGLKINEEADQASLRPEVAFNQSQCLSGTADTMEAYFSGKASAAQISHLFDCASQSLELFVSRARGQDVGRYTPQELRQFLEKYFLGDLRIPDALLVEAMEIKRLFVGGSATELTREELLSASELLQVIKRELQRIRPYQPLTVEHLGDVDQRIVDEVAVALEKAGRAIGERLQKNGVTYSFASFERLLEEAVKFHQSSFGRSTALESIRDKIGMLRILKGALISQERDGIESDEWVRFFSEGARWHALWIRFAHLKRNYGDWTRGAGRERFLELLRESRTLFSVALSHRKNRSITYEELERIFLLLEPRSLPLSLDAMREVSQPILIWLLKDNGSSASVLTADAVEHAFDVMVSYLQGTIRSSDPLLSEAMTFKQVVAGGRLDYMTRDEFAKLSKVILLIRQHYDRLQPFFPLTPEHLSSLDPVTMEAALNALVQAGDDLASVLAGASLPYSFESFERLLNELDRVYGTTFRSFRDWIEIYRQHRSFLETLKSVFIAPPAHSVEVGQWEPALRDGARWMAHWTRFLHIRKFHPDWQSGPGREHWVSWVSEAREMLKRTVSRHPGARISFHGMDNLINHREFLETTHEKRDGIKSFSRVAICRMLGGYSGVAYTDCENKGLSQPVLDRTWEHFRYWFEGSRLLEGVFNRLGGLSGEYSVAEISKTLKLPGAFSEFDKDIIGMSAKRDLTETLDPQKPKARMYYESNLMISYPSEGPLAARRDLRSFYDLSQSHWIRSAVRMLVESYVPGRRWAEHPKGAEFSVFNVLCADVWEFLSKMTIVSPENNDEKYFRQRFRDANLFVYAADSSNHVMNVEEGVDFVGSMISAKVISSQLHRFIESQCPKGLVNIFGYRSIEPECYRKYFFAILEEPEHPYFVSMEGKMSGFPGMTAHYKALRESHRRAEFRENLEKLARKPDFKPSDYLESWDTEGFVTVLKYVETIFAKFDTDYSGTLVNRKGGINEIAPVLGMIRETLLAKIREKDAEFDEDKLMEVFVFFLKHGRRPHGKWDWLKNGGEEIEADRNFVLRALLIMASNEDPEKK